MLALLALTGLHPFSFCNCFLEPVRSGLATFKTDPGSASLDPCTQASGARSCRLVRSAALTVHMWGRSRFHVSQFHACCFCNLFWLAVMTVSCTRCLCLAIGLALSLWCAAFPCQVGMDASEMPPAPAEPLAWPSLTDPVWALHEALQLQVPTDVLEHPDLNRSVQSFGLAATSFAQFDAWLTDLGLIGEPSGVLADLRLLWHRAHHMTCAMPLPSAPGFPPPAPAPHTAAPASQPAQPTPEPSASWQETFPAKLSADKTLALKQKSSTTPLCHPHASWLWPSSKPLALSGSLFPGSGGCLRQNWRTCASAALASCQGWSWPTSFWTRCRLARCQTPSACLALASFCVCTASRPRGPDPLAGLAPFCGPILRPKRSQPTCPHASSRESTHARHPPKAKQMSPV